MEVVFGHLFEKMDFFFFFFKQLTDFFDLMVEELDQRQLNTRKKELMLQQW